VSKELHNIGFLISDFIRWRNQGILSTNWHSCCFFSSLQRVWCQRVNLCWIFCTPYFFFHFNFFFNVYYNFAIKHFLMFYVFFFLFRFADICMASESLIVRQDQPCKTTEDCFDVLHCPYPLRAPKCIEGRCECQMAPSNTIE
jgi:hypothetical protein